MDAGLVSLPVSAMQCCIHCLGGLVKTRRGSFTRLPNT